MSKIMIGKYQGTIYAEGGGYTGALDLGYDGAGRRLRAKRKGKTKTAVKDKLIAFVADHEKGIQTAKQAETYTVREAVEDWLDKGTKLLDPGTVAGYRGVAAKHLTPVIGALRLKRLQADDVDTWLDSLTGELSTRSLQSVHSILRRAILMAQARNKVERNVALLVTTPKGKDGRPSNALTLDQATAVIDQAKSTPLHAYVVMSIMTGIRTEEARALRWDHVVAWTDDEDWQPVTEAGFDHDRFAVHVWRSVRAHGDTKTQRSRRTLELPHEAADALRAHHERQTEQRIEAGQLWHDTGLVFTTNVGTALDAANVRRSFKAITKDAKVGEGWTPRETRHTFVSIMSDNDVPLEKIADLVGHKGTSVTERVYRHQLKPAIRTGADTINAIFKTPGKEAKTA